MRVSGNSPLLGALSILLHVHLAIAAGSLAPDPCPSLRAQNAQLLEQLAARDAKLSGLRSELSWPLVLWWKARIGVLPWERARCVGWRARLLSPLPIGDVPRRMKVAFEPSCPRTHAVPSLMMCKKRFIAESADVSALQVTWTRSK